MRITAGIAALILTLYAASAAVLRANPAVAGGAGDTARRSGAAAASLFAVKPLKLSLPAMYSSQGSYGESYGSGYAAPPIHIDALFGAIVPFEDSGLAFGKATSDEDFDAGGMFGFRGRLHLTRYFFLGGEFDFAIHDVDGGDVLFPGELGRVYLMLPLGFEIPLGPPARSAQLGFSVAPGLQIALPHADHHFQDLQAFLGRFIDEDDFVGFTLRAAVNLHVPISYHLSFVLEASYDWAYAEADVTVFNSFGRVIERRSDEIDLSSLNAFAGLTFTF